MSKSILPKGFFIGAIVGGISALLFSPRSGKANRKLLEKKIKELDAKLRDPKTAEEIQKLLMKISQDAPAKYVAIKKELNEGLNLAKEKLEKVEYKKYVDMIESAIKNVLKGKKISTEKTVSALRDKLLSLWGDEPVKPVGRKSITNKSSKKLLKK